MLNLYEEIRTNLRYNKFDLGDLLFTEYTCPIDRDRLGIWTHTDYLVHVVSGKKRWHTTSGTWTAEAGQTLFFKKGAAIVEQSFDENFCLLLFFIPDAFIRDVVRELRPELSGTIQRVPFEGSALRINNDMTLSVYFQSMLAFFAHSEKPSASLLRLKLKEFITSIVLGRNNPELASYFRSVADSVSTPLTGIMEANFRYHLSLEEFAQLSNRSLSSFKRAFQEAYHEAPGKWLLKRRLEYASTLLRRGELNVSQVALESGFEDLSHFSKTFKDRFGVPPASYRTKSTIEP